MEVDKNIIEYTIAELTGELSEDGKEELSVWIKASEINYKQYNKVKEVFQHARDLEVYAKIDKATAWEKLHSQTGGRKKNLSVWSRIAAAIVIILIGSGIIHILQRNDDEASIRKIKPHIAYIEISNGEVIHLDSINGSQNLEAEGVRLLRDSNRLVYQMNLLKPVRNLKNTLVVPRGQDYKMTLADGSVVWVNAETRLTYPLAFNGDERKIWLKSGEIFIDVKHDDKQPFIVNTKGVDVKVLGTRFNVNAYDDNENIQVTLESGKVRIQTADRAKLNFESFTIMPRQQFKLDYNSEKVYVRDVDVDLYTAWTRGEYYFENSRLEDIMITLSRWYDYNVVYDSETLKELRFSGRVKKKETIYAFLDALGQFENIHFKIDNQNITISKFNK